MLQYKKAVYIIYFFSRQQLQFHYTTCKVKHITSSNNSQDNLKGKVVQVAIVLELYHVMCPSMVK